MTVKGRGKKKLRQGTVVSDKMKKTLVVDVERSYRHPRYAKVIRAISRCYVHDEKGEAHQGDIIRIVECRPLSKLKRWRMLEIVKKGRGLQDRTKSEEEVRELHEELREDSAEALPATEEAQDTAQDEVKINSEYPDSDKA